MYKVSVRYKYGYHPSYTYDIRYLNTLFDSDEMRNSQEMGKFM